MIGGSSWLASFFLANGNDAWSDPIPGRSLPSKGATCGAGEVGVGSRQFSRGARWSMGFWWILMEFGVLTSKRSFWLFHIIPNISHFCSPITFPAFPTSQISPPGARLNPRGPPSAGPPSAGPPSVHRPSAPRRRARGRGRRMGRSALELGEKENVRMWVWVKIRYPKIMDG